MESGTTICSYCHTSIISSPLRKEEKFFCSEGCWRKFNDEEQKIMRKCPSCAEFVKWEAKKCKHCGEILPETEMPEEIKQIIENRNKRQQNSSNSLFISLVIFLLLLMGGVVYFLFFLPH